MYLLKQFATLTGFTVSSNVLYALSIPLLAILYTPEEFGVLGQFLAAGGILQVFCSLRLEKSILLAQSDLEISKSIQFVLAVTTILAFSLLIVFLLINNYIYKVTSVWFYSLLYAFLASIFIVFTNALVSNRQYFTLGFVRFLRKCFEVCVAVFLGYYAFSNFGLVYAIFSAQIILILYFFYTNQLKTFLVIRFDFDKLKIMIKNNIQFPRFDVPSSLLSQISISLPIFTIEPLFGLNVLGYYVLATRVLAAPIAALGKPLQDIGRNMISDASSLSDTEIKRKYIKLMFFIFILSSLVYVLINAIFDFFVSKPEFRDWSNASVIMQILTPLYIFRLATSPFLVVLTMKKRLDIQFRVQMISTLLMAVVFVWCHYQSVVIEKLLMYYALIYVVTYSISCFASYRVVTKNAK